MADAPQIPEAVRRIADANLRYYQGLGQLTVDYVRAMAGLLGELRAAVAPPQAAPARQASAPSPATPSAPPPVLVLEGQGGAEAAAVFRVSNDLRRRVSAPVVVSAFTDESGREHRLPLRVEPAVVELGAGEQALVEVHAVIPPEVEAGVPYRAEITVPGLAAAGVPVLLRRLPGASAPDDAAPAAARARRGPAKRVASPRARRGRGSPA